MNFIIRTLIFYTIISKPVDISRCGSMDEEEVSNNNKRVAQTNVEKKDSGLLQPRHIST